MEILVMKVLHGATQLEGISYEIKEQQPKQNSLYIGLKPRIC